MGSRSFHSTPLPEREHLKDNDSFFVQPLGDTGHNLLAQFASRGLVLAVVPDALDINAELKWIIRELGKHDIEQLNPDREWPQSLYFGREFRKYIQIRVSNHEKPYLPSKGEIDIVVKPSMTHEEIVLAVAAAIRKFCEIEEAISEDLFPSDGSGF